MKSKSLLSFLLVSLITLPLFAQPQPQIELVPFASGFEQPVDIANPPDDDRLFVVQQRGLIRIVDLQGNIADQHFLDLSAQVSQEGSERGLLGLAFHPDYTQNRFFFVNYTRQEDGHTVISRFSTHATNPDIADPESEKVILVIEQPYANHNAGQLLFGPDGYLYIPTGDGGAGGDPEDHAQSPGSLLGKILRIDIDVDDQTPYAIPGDNPFVDDQNTLDEIWALGLRNPWRNSFDRYTGDLWIADVGQSEREEINFQPFTSTGGENYGWRCYEGTMPFNPDNCEDETHYVFPVFEYEHEGTGCTGAVTGGYVYRGALYNGMFGYYLLADFCTGVFYHVSQTHDGQVSNVLGEFAEFEYTTFGQDRYGELYVALHSSGEIRRLVDTDDCQPVAWIMEDDLTVELLPGETITIQAFFNPLLEYQWNRDEQPLAGETDSELEISEEGSYTVTVTNPENDCTNTSVPFEVTLGTVSVISQTLDNITVYPNPATDNIFVEGLPIEGTSRINLIDITGKTVFTGVSHETQVNIPVTLLPSGLYLLKVDHSTGMTVKRVMVQRRD